MTDAQASQWKRGATTGKPVTNASPRTNSAPCQNPRLTNSDNKPMILPMQSSKDETPNGQAPSSRRLSMTPSEDAAWRAEVDEDSRQLMEDINAKIAEAKRRGVPLSEIIPVH